MYVQLCTQSPVFVNVCTRMYNRQKMQMFDFIISTEMPTYIQVKIKAKLQFTFMAFLSMM
jgi:hypothetical protein